MNRRDFFKKSSLAISAIAISGAANTGLEKIFANPKSNGHFSFEVITDKPVKAIKLSEEFFNSNPMGDKVIRFSQFPVNGEMYGDIAFVNNGRLINYKIGND